MKTENPYNDSNKFNRTSQSAWEQGYSAAMADMQPIAFSDRLPESEQNIIAFDKNNEANIIEFRTKYCVVRNDYNEVIDGVYIWENSDFYLNDSSCDRFNYYTHWLSIPSIEQKN